jgi:hypothetical protein
MKTNPKSGRPKNNEAATSTQTQNTAEPPDVPDRPFCNLAMAVDMAVGLIHLMSKELERLYERHADGSDGSFINIGPQFMTLGHQCAAELIAASESTLHDWTVLKCEQWEAKNAARKGGAR